MFFLEVLNRIVSIVAGIVGSLNGLIALIQKCKPYIKRRREEKEKDPSACLAAPDGSDEDRLCDQ